MVVLKIVLAGAAIVALMLIAQAERWPQRAGFVGVCTPTPAARSASGGYWYACKEGIINGYPNLEADRCVSEGVTSKREIWQCDVVLDSLPGA
jgi:hypothetical protein